MSAVGLFRTLSSDVTIEVPSVTSLLSDRVCLLCRFKICFKLWWRFPINPAKLGIFLFFLLDPEFFSLLHSWLFFGYVIIICTIDCKEKCIMSWYYFIIPGQLWEFELLIIHSISKSVVFHVSYCDCQRSSWPCLWFQCMLCVTQCLSWHQLQLPGVLACFQYWLDMVSPLCT